MNDQRPRSTNPDRDGQQAAAGDASAASLLRQKALVTLGRRAASPPDCAILVEDAVALTAATLDCELCMVAETRGDGKELSLTLYEAAADGPWAAIDRDRVAVTGAESLAGFAMDCARPLAVPSLAAEQRFYDVLLAKHGVQSAVVAPLYVLGRAYGALTACTRRPRTFSEECLLFAETVSHLVATTIARSQTEQWLHDEQRRHADVLRSLDAMVLILDPGGAVVRVNATCERISGFTSAEIRGRGLASALSVPADMPAFTQAIERARGGDATVEFESRLLTKHGVSRHMAWTLATVKGNDGDLEAVIVTGIDVTHERELEQRLQRLEPVEMGARLTAPPLNSERRKRPRRSYPYRQMLAPIVDGRSPMADDFVSVQCNDIGPDGFSFLIDRPFSTDTVLVALGTPRMLTYLVAQVVHVNRVKREDIWTFLVGCRYVGRAAEFPGVAAGAAGGQATPVFAGHAREGDL